MLTLARLWLPGVRAVTGGNIQTKLLDMIALSRGIILTHRQSVLYNLVNCEVRVGPDVVE